MSRHPFKWPTEVYTELRQMGQSASLTAIFDGLIQVARSEVVEGLAVDPTSGQLFVRSVTAEQILNVITENEDLFKQKGGSDNQKKKKTPLGDIAQVEKQLNSIIQAAPGAMSLVAWDDHHSQKVQRGLTYAITKDSSGKRITLVLKGGEDIRVESLSANILANINVLQQELQLPPPAKKKTNNSLAVESIALHNGLYKYLFELQAQDDGTASSGKSKFEEIVQALKPIFAAYPKYKLYVTGEGVGAALAQVMAFFLASDSSTPKPVSCLVFGAPRVGNHDYLQACIALEQDRCLRTCRLVHPQDGILPNMPPVGFSHAGFQVQLASSLQVPPTVTYPKLQDTCWNRFERAWNNRPRGGLSAGPISLEQYVQALEHYKEQLLMLDLNELYSDIKNTGYLIAPLPVEK